MLIEDLVEGLNLEDESNEFKAIIKEGKNPNTGQRLEIVWLKELTGFANSFGGTLYVGVEDGSHKVLPLDHQTVDSVVLMVQRLVKAHVEPGLKYLFRKIAVPSTKPTRYVLAIDVEKSPYGPTALKFGGIPIYYVRHFGSTSAASTDELRDLFLESDMSSYDAFFTEEKFDKGDFAYLFDVYKQNNGRDLSLKELQSIGFVSLDGRLCKGALLFKDGCEDGKTLVVCSQFKGQSKGSSDFYFTKEIKGNLLREYFDIIDFVSGRTADGFVKKEDRHVSLISYPKRALSEAVANALVHRNYFINGSQIEVNLFSNRLEIVSPGSLLGSRWLKDEKDLSSIPPNRRNEVICAVFYMCKLMEKRGSGFDKIEEEYRPYGDEFAPFANSNNLYFSLTMFDLAEKNPLAAEGEFAKVDITPIEAGSKYDLTILGYCFYKRRTVSQIASFLGIAPSSYFRKSVLGGLLSKGLLIPFKQGNAVAYTASKELVKLAD